jgi:transcription antitermination factor NusG
MTAAAWYVLRITSGYESRVAKTLQHTPGFDGFCPMRQEHDIVHHQRVARLRPLWPTYGFASWPLDDPERWHAVLSGDPYIWHRDETPETVKSILPGVNGIIGGATPLQVPRKYVDLLIAEANADGTIPSLVDKLEELQRGYTRGSQVMIVGGAFNEHCGTCNWVDKTGTSVELIIFGRSSPVFIGSSDPSVKVVKNGDAIGATKSAKRRERDRRTLANRVARKAARYISRIVP